MCGGGGGGAVGVGMTCILETGFNNKATSDNVHRKRTMTPPKFLTG